MLKQEIGFVTLHPTWEYKCVPPQNTTCIDFNGFCTESPVRGNVGRADGDNERMRGCSNTELSLGRVRR